MTDNTSYHISASKKGKHYLDQNPITDFTIDLDEATQRAFPNLQKYVDENMKPSKTDAMGRDGIIKLITTGI